MRIVFVLTQSLESPNGAGRTLPMAKVLQRRGHSVCIIALHHDYRSLSEKRVLVDHIPVWYVAQMQVKKVGNQKLYFPIWKLIWFMLLATFRLTFALLKTPADVIQVCKAQPMNLLAAWVKKLVHHSTILVDSDDYETLNNRFGRPWQQKIVAYFERWAAKIADGIIVSTQFMWNFYARLGFDRHKIRLIPHGYDPARFAGLNTPNMQERISRLRADLSIPLDAPVLVFVGSISLVCHAVDLLLEAVLMLQSSHPEIYLVIVGGGEDYDFIKEKARSLGIDSKIRFTGRVPRDEVPWYYRLGRLSIDPKRQGILEESLAPLKLVESLAAGVPAVAADIGDVREIMGEAALYYHPGDTADLAKTICQAIENDRLIAEMTEAANLRREKFSWDNKAGEWEDLYQSIR